MQKTPEHNLNQLFILSQVILLVLWSLICLVDESILNYFLIIDIHAREWITSAVCTHVIDQLLNGPDPIMLGYLDEFDIYIVPIANPDGFDYTHTVVSLADS